MISFIAFLLTIAGCVNWLLIGMLQYDFIAGIFGWQGSIFSRIIYIFFGIGAIYVVIRTIVGKGNFKIWEKKKNKQEKIPSYANVEAGEELPSKPIKKKWWQFWKKNKKPTTPEKIEINVQPLSDPTYQTQQTFEKEDLNQDDKNNLFDEHLTSK